MNSKERTHAALEGKPVDQLPVTVAYQNLYIEDHFSELTGLPFWKMEAWRHGPLDEYVHILGEILALTPFDIIWPGAGISRRAREQTTIIEKDGKAYRRNKLDGSMTLIQPGASGHAIDYVVNETQYVFDRQDVDEKVKIEKAEQMIAEGWNDHLEAIVSALGRQYFILAGWFNAPFFRAADYLGMVNNLILAVRNPELLDYLLKKLLEQNIELIRMLAAGGGDGIYVDDIQATNDVISLKMYERFCLPYMTAMVREIQRLGKKAVVVYCGGVADRLEQIASTGADGFLMEATMKGFTNDLAETVTRIGRRITMFGNVDPLKVLQNGSDLELEIELRRQADAGRRGRGFIMSTGSPVTPGTRLERVQRYIEIARKL